MIDWIENWYSSNCDGNWEHMNVIKIETLDNPGWNVEIDFNNTSVERDNITWKLVEISENDWFGFSIENNIFSAAGDPYKLNLILELFKKVVDGSDDSELLEMKTQ